MPDCATYLMLTGVLLLQTAPPKPPTAAADVGPFGAAIVRRAAALIPTAAQWDRAASDRCPAPSTRFSLQCALQEAADAAGDGQPAISDCRFHRASGGWEGSCGPLFDELSIFSVTNTGSVKTGVWRKDATPRDVFAGTMSDPASAVMYEARQLIGALTTKKDSAGLVGYNNDPDTTFTDLQKFFTELEHRVLANGAADLTRATTDDVEIEIYDGGVGVIRTYRGWFPVTGFSVGADSMRFQFDGRHEVPPNAVDREILERASRVIASDAVWNRADNRQCPADAKTWSLYCAVERAMIEVTGGFNHRRPAGELVRQIVDTRSADRGYSHRMMDYNNDPRTQLSDVRSLFAEAISRIK